MENVIPFEREGYGNSRTSLQYKIEAYQTVIRRFAPRLKAHEFIVLMQVLDRTAGWGELEASFTLTALREGDDVYGGFAEAVSERSMFRALASLEAKGVLQRRHDPRKFDKRHYWVNLEWRSKKAVILPERLKNKAADPCHGGSTTCHADSAPCHSDSLYTGNHSQVVLTDNLPADPASRAGAIKPEKVRSGEVGAPITARLDKNKTRDSAASIEHVWRTAVAETFPGHPTPAWATREKGQARTAMKKWHQPDVTFHDFMEWCARNWTAIMRQQFKWMTKSPPPAVPALPFLFSFMDGFIECYAENKLEAWLSDRDRTELERLMSQGNTYEAASAVLAERKVTLALREEMEKREAEVQLQGKIARVRLQKAEKLMDLGAAPPHPWSVAAERARAAARSVNPPPRRTTVQVPDVDFPEVMVPFVDPDRNPFD